MSSEKYIKATSKKRVTTLLLVEFFLFSALFLSGCQNSFNSNSKLYTATQEDNSGTGLNVKFNIDKKEIKTGILIYTLVLENTGKENVILNKQNFQIYSDKYGQKSIITEESFDDFYSKLFKNGNQLTLSQNQKYMIDGVLKIDQAFLKNKNINSFLITLDINYKYKTDYFSNLLITKKYNIYKLIQGSTLQQAAPIQIKSLELIPDFGDKYKLQLTMSDLGNEDSYILNINKKKISVQDFNVKFMNNKLTSCQIIENQDGTDQSYNTNNLNTNINNILLQKGNSVKISCEVDTFNSGIGTSFNTQVSGSFSYNYPITIQKKITISD